MMGMREGPACSAPLKLLMMGMREGPACSAPLKLLMLGMREGSACFAPLKLLMMGMREGPAAAAKRAACVSSAPHSHYTHYTHYTHDLHYSHYPHACLLTLQNTERWAHVVVLQQLCQQHAQSFTYAHTHASYLCIYETGMCGGAVSAVCTTLTPVLTHMHPTSIFMKQARVEELCQQQAKLQEQHQEQQQHLNNITASQVCITADRVTNILS